MRKKLKEAFEETDTDKSGALDYDELKDMLHKAGFKANDNTMKVNRNELFQLYNIQLTL